MAPLDLLTETERHIVSEIVEPKLIVGAVSDVGSIGGVFFRPLHSLNNQANGQAHETVYLSHLLTVPLGQIIIDGDYVDAITRQGV